MNRENWRRPELRGRESGTRIRRAVRWKNHACELAEKTQRRGPLLTGCSFVCVTAIGVEKLREDVTWKVLCVCGICMMRSEE